MLRIAMTLFVLVLIAVGSFVVATTGHLTDPVATHFDRDFLANGWMTRDGYLRFTLAFATLVPIVVALAVGGLPRVAPRSVNIPNRDYWLAPERRATTLDGIAARACVLGALLAVFIAGVHALILRGECNGAAAASCRAVLDAAGGRSSSSSPSGSARSGAGIAPCRDDRSPATTRPPRR